MGTALCTECLCAWLYGLLVPQRMFPMLDDKWYRVPISTVQIWDNLTLNFQHGADYREII